MVFCFVLLLATQRGIWELNSPTRDGVHTPCIASVDHQGGPTPNSFVGEAHWLKPPALARRHSNHLCEVLYDRRSW